MTGKVQSNQYNSKGTRSIHSHKQFKRLKKISLIQ